MKAVITAAGKGSRMFPIGETTPKLLTPVFNRPLIHNFIDILKDHIDEIIIVIDASDFGEKIKEYVNSLDVGIKFSFAIQHEQKGTGHALFMAKDFIPSGERFLYMYGDDIYSKIDIENVLKNDYALAGKIVDDPEKWGILQADDEGYLTKIIEKPFDFVGNLANIGIYLLDTEIFEIYSQITESSRGEYEVTDMASLFCLSKKMKVVPVEGYWIPLGYPWHLLEAHEKLIDSVEFSYDGLGIEPGASIHGRVKVGKNTIIKAGTYIEGDVVIGDNCVIGPNAYLRGVTVIGDNCKIGMSCEVKNSTIFSGTKIPHLSLVADSILGYNVNFGVGSVTTNWRHDNELIKTMIKGQLVSTGRNKFGAVIGDNVRLGGRTTIYPGRKIAANKTTLPGEIISKDLV